MPRPWPRPSFLALVALCYLAGPANAQLAPAAGEPAAQTATDAMPGGLSAPSLGPAASRAVEEFALQVRLSYGHAALAAAEFRQAVAAFLADPTDERLAATRDAWTRARQPYLRTEVFRFADGPIEAVEGRLNAWPLNETFLDALIADEATPITREAVLARDQVTDEADVTTGWHAIEYLLWGADTSLDGPGARPASDFAPGTPPADRRRALLTLLTDLLAEDLAALEAAWDPNTADAYVDRFRALPTEEALTRIFTSAATLAGFELANERLAVALDTGDQEDEQSCFSDTTHQDFEENVAGLQAVAGILAGAVEPVDPALAFRLKVSAVRLGLRARALPRPVDRVLASAPDSPERAAMEAMVTDLERYAELLTRGGAALGLEVRVGVE